MEFYFNYPPLNLRGMEKFFYKTIIISSRIFLIIVGVTFLFAGLPVLRVIGLWLIVIFTYYFLVGKYKAMQDLRFSSSENLRDYCSGETLNCLLDAFKDAQTGAIEQAQILLLLKLLQVNTVRQMLARLNCGNQEFQQESLSYLSPTKTLLELDLRKSDTYAIKHNILPIICQARELGRAFSLPLITPDLLVIALGNVGGFYVKDLLFKLRLSEESLIAALILSRFSRKKINNLSAILQPPIQLRWLQLNKKREILKKTFAPINFTSSVVDLTAAATFGQIGFLIGHNQEIDAIITILTKQPSCQLLLVGDEGMGKKTLVEHLAWRFALSQIPTDLINYRIVTIASGLVGTSELQKSRRLIEALHESAASGYIILYLPDFDQWPKISQVNFQAGSAPVIITMSNPDIISQFTQRHKHFKIIAMQSLSRQESVALLACKTLFLQTEFKIYATPQAVAAAASLSQFRLSSAEKVLRRGFELAKKEGCNCVTEEIIGDVAWR